MKPDATAFFHREALWDLNLINYPRLVKLKNQYDPMNLFRLNANVVPKV